MSTCISRHGEYGSHIPDPDHVCTRCGVLDEDALIEELRSLRTALAAALDPATTEALFDQRDAAITERDQLRAEVEDLKFSRNEADLDRIYVHRLLAAAREEVERLRTELAALKRVPRCGNTVDSVLSDTPHLVCDLPYGHPGTWHGCDQWGGGISTRAEWSDRTEPGRDWTVKNGTSNSSDAYEECAATVARLIRGSAHDIVSGNTGAVARLVVSQLAHTGLRLAPSTQDAEVERMRPVLEAALAWHARGGPGQSRDLWQGTSAENDLEDAVDVYNQPPSPDTKGAT